MAWPLLAVQYATISLPLTDAQTTIAALNCPLMQLLCFLLSSGANGADVPSVAQNTCTRSFQKVTNSDVDSPNGDAHALGMIKLTITAAAHHHHHHHVAENMKTRK